MNREKKVNYPVTDEQILPMIRLIKLSHGKDRKELLAAAIDLLMYLVYSKAKSYKAQPFYGDLIQEGQIGLIMAINEFDEKRGTKFFWFADWFLKSRFKSVLRTYLFKQRDVYKAYSREERDEFYFDPDPVEESETRDILMKEIDRLDKRSKEMIILKFGLDGERPLTFKEIGQINNLSRQRIEQISSVAIQKLSKRRSIKELHGGL